MARAAAKLAGEKYYFTGKPCPKGHVAKRSTVKGVCYSCQQESLVKWRAANSERERQGAARYRANISPEMLERRRARILRRYHEVEKFSPRARALRNANVRKRQWNVKRATPSWVNHEEIKEIYIGRPPGFHVDHVVPLSGKGVCGLHVPWNLQYLPASENHRKSRKFTVEA